MVGDSEITQAVEFLKKVLAPGPLPYQRVYDLAEEQGIKKRHVKAAKTIVGLVTLQAQINQEVDWLWALPDWYRSIRSRVD